MFRRLHNWVKDLPVSGLVCLTAVLAIAIPITVITALFYHQAENSLILLEGSSMSGALSVLTLPDGTPVDQVEARAEELASRLSRGEHAAGIS